MQMPRSLAVTSSRHGSCGCSPTEKGCPKVDFRFAGGACAAEDLAKQAGGWCQYSLLRLNALSSDLNLFCTYLHRANQDGLGKSVSSLAGIVTQPSYVASFSCKHLRPHASHEPHPSGPSLHFHNPIPIAETSYCIPKL